MKIKAVLPQTNDLSAALIPDCFMMNPQKSCGTNVTSQKRKADAASGLLSFSD